jgi:hypothetical protein
MPALLVYQYTPSDIRGIFCEACELVGVYWIASGAHTIYVSRKTDVAALDRFIGPKRMTHPSLL